MKKNSKFNIGDAVYITNFENKILTIINLDKAGHTCVYLTDSGQFTTIQVPIEVLKLNRERVMF